MSFPVPQPDPDNHIITAPIGGEQILQINPWAGGTKGTPYHPPIKKKKRKEKRSLSMFSNFYLKVKVSGAGVCVCVCGREWWCVELGLPNSPPSQKPGLAPFPLFYSRENCPDLVVWELKIEGEMENEGRHHGGRRRRVLGVVCANGVCRNLAPMRS